MSRRSGRETHGPTSYPCPHSLTTHNPGDVQSLTQVGRASREGTVAHHPIPRLRVSDGSTPPPESSTKWKVLGS